MGARRLRPRSALSELDARQTKAVERALTLDGFGFFPEPRVGKTRMAMAVIQQRRPARALLISPKNVLHVWHKAIQEYPCPGTEYMIVNYDQMVNSRRRKKIRTWLSKTGSLVLLDEGHRIKRRGSKWSRACRTFAVKADYRLLLTGTPIAQGIQDTWALFDFIRPGLFGKFEDFSRLYLRMGGWQNRKVIGTRNLKGFNRIFHAHSARIKLNEVAQRPIMIRRQRVELDLNATALRHYRELEKELITETRKQVVSTELVITLSLRLQQICGGFLTNGEEVEQVSKEKLRAIQSILIADEKPKVICCRYLAEIDAIEKMCRRLKIKFTTIKGGQPLEQPFTEGVAIVQIQSGLGIDLSAAKVIVWYSWNYSFIDYEQMRFRVLSRTNTRVDYIFLMIKNSVDGLIYQAVTQKRRLSDLICDHYRSLI